MTEKTKRLVDQRCIIDDEIVYIDLERNKDPKNYGYNLLSLALEKKDAKAVRYLTLPEIGINIDAYKDGYTLLHVVAQENDTKAGELLIKCGADIETTSKTDVGGYTALHLVAQKGHLAFAELLLNNKASVNSLSSTESKITPLHDAAYDGHVDIAQLLIEHGAIVDAKDRHNCTPLELACSNNQSEVVKLLLQKGADPYLKNNNGEIPLHNAAYNGCADIVSILMDVVKDKDEYINMQSNFGSTALHLIAHNINIHKKREEHKKVIKLLLENGANLHTKNNQGKNPIDIAIERKNIEFIKLLVECEREQGQNTSLYEAIKEGKINKVNLLIQNGANINSRNEKGLTPLDLALQKNDQSMTQSLKENGAKTSLELKIAVAVLITLTIMTLGLALAVYSAINVLTRIHSRSTDDNLSKQKDIPTSLHNQVILQKDNVLNKT